MSIEPKKINLRSYNKVWKIENRIYAIQNIVLPVPVSPREVLYFFIIAFNTATKNYSEYFTFCCGSFWRITVFTKEKIGWKNAP